MFESNCAEALYYSGCDSRDAIGREVDDPQIEVRQATSDDVLEFFGEPQAGTLKALVAIMDGKPVGIIGIIRDRMYGRYFCDFRSELEPYLRSMKIMRAIKESMRIVESYKGPVLSVAEHVEGCRILNRLGFVHFYGVIYIWPR